MKNNLSQISKQNWEIADLENQSFAEFNDLSESINLMKFKLHDYFSRIQEQNEIGWLNILSIILRSINLQTVINMNKHNK